MTKEERIASEKERLKGMYSFEDSLRNDAAYIFGIDEAGRGPLCGPVYAACCVLPRECEILYLNDSKKLSEKKREALYEEITGRALAYGVGFASPQRIDDINILNATMEAMADAYSACMDMYRERVASGYFADNGNNAAPSDNLNTAVDSMDSIDSIPSAGDSMVLVDGNRTVPGIFFPQRCVIGGDAKCPSISAASIIAKVTRDHLMEEYDRQYPGYGFARHKGYGTREHIEAIRRLGVLDIHRKTFLKKLL